MSLEQIAARGAFTLEAFQQDQSMAESLHNFPAHMREQLTQNYTSWMYAKGRYIATELGGREPDLKLILRAIITSRSTCPICMGMPIKTVAQQNTVAKILATTLGESRATLVDAIQEFLHGETEEQRATIEAWDTRYTAFVVDEAWSELDARIWADCKWTRIDDTPTIVVRTGKLGCEEYKTVGCDPDEVLSAFQAAGRTHLICKFLDRVIELHNQVPYDGHDIAVIDGRRLSAACADYLYTKQCIKDKGGAPVGRSIGYTKNNRPTELQYIAKSMEAFLKPVNYVDVKVLANDQQTPCYNYLPLPSHADIETPVIDAWLADVAPSGHAHEYKDVLAASLACAIVPGNTTRQAKWLHGGGYDGKSVFLNALARYFGSSAASLQIASMKDRFGMATIENKRVVIVDDQKDPTIIAQPWFHQASGGSFGVIERKFKQPRSCNMHAHFFIAENIPPNINVWEANQISRVIYIKLRKRTEEEMLAKGFIIKDGDGVIHRVGDSTFVDQMTAEIPKLLAYGLSIYKRMCPTNGDILVPPCMVQSMYDHCVSPETEILTSYLDNITVTADPAHFLPRTDLLEELKLKLKTDYRTNQTPTHVERWIAHNYQIDLTKRHNDRGWFGLKLVEQNTISWRDRQFNEDRLDRIMGGGKTQGAANAGTYRAPSSPAPTGVGHAPRKSPSFDITIFSDEPCPTPPVR